MYKSLVLAVALLAVAQQPAPPSTPQQSPRFRGGTNFVQVDVFATRNGVPAQDLTVASAVAVLLWAAAAVVFG